jgi:hypothetical protein
VRVSPIKIRFDVKIALDAAWEIAPNIRRELQVREVAAAPAFAAAFVLTVPLPIVERFGVWTAH